VKNLQHGPILTFLQAFVVEGQPPILDRHDHKTRSAQDLDVEGTLLFRPEGVLDNVRANQFDGAIHLLGVPQAEPMGNLLHEVDQGW
jgi:hypothetical protein